MTNPSWLRLNVRASTQSRHPSFRRLRLEPLEQRILMAATTDSFLTGPGRGGPPRVRVIDSQLLAEESTFFAYSQAFNGGVRLASGDISGDGTADIITGAGVGGGPQVRVFDGVTGQRLPEVLGSFFAFPRDFTGGIFVAAGDVNGDGRDDIIAAMGAGGTPQVKVFNGLDGSELSAFFAYDLAFRGGVSVAAGDLDGDGQDEIITGPGSGMGPQVKVFNGLTGEEQRSFFAYAPTFTGGVSVASGDVDADGNHDIVTGAGRGGGPQVRVFSGDDGVRLHSFFAYNSRFTGGVHVAAGDVDGDGRADIITGAGAGGGPHVRARSGVDGSLLTQFFAYDTHFTGGVYVAWLGDEAATLGPTIRVDSPVANEATAQTVVMGQVSDAGPTVVSLTVQLDGAPAFEVPRDATGQFEFDTALALDGSDDGPHLLRFVALDAAGNTTGPIDVAYTLDSPAIAQLPGLPEELANAILPSIPTPVSPASNLTIDDRADGTLLPTSRTHLLVKFTDTATVGEVNTLLDALDAVIFGTLPTIDLVLLAVPDSGDFTNLDAALGVLQVSHLVDTVVQDVALDVGSLPAASNAGDFAFNFPPSHATTANANAFDGNWGLEAMRVPQMWNLNDYARRQEPWPRTAVFDAGFNDTNDDGLNDHPQADLIRLTTRMWDGATFGHGAQDHAHGEHVAGIIGAQFQNGLGVAGVNPFAERKTFPDDQFLGISIRAGAGGGSISQQLSATFSVVLSDFERMLNHWTDLKVVNVSLGYNWAKASYNGTRSTVDPNVSLDAQAVAHDQGLFVRQVLAGHPDVLIVAAAGNDSGAIRRYTAEIDAQWASPFNWAALGASEPLSLRSNQIIVVEAVKSLVADPDLPPEAWQYTKRDSSNVNGHIAAPGEDVLSTVGSNLPNPNANPPASYTDYVRMSGTSMAAPHVAGLAGYLLNVAPDLGIDRLRQLLTESRFTRGSVLGAGDALPIGVASPAPMIDAFASVIGIDLIKADAEKHVQRALVDVDDGTTDGNLVVNPFTDIVRASMATSDRYRGDGHITMSDFRAWRDAYLQVHGQLFADPPEHFARDLNFDGVVATANGNMAAAPSHPADVPAPYLLEQVSLAPSEAVGSRYDFNGDGRIGDWFETAPFKIDPDLIDATGENWSYDLRSDPGFLRDIDVLADPAFWNVTSNDHENVAVRPQQEGANVADEGFWETWSYLLRNEDPPGASLFLKELPDYLHSFDLHVALDWNEIDPAYESVAILVQSEMERPDYAQQFEREGEFPRGTRNFVVTIPLWTGNVRIRVVGIDEDILPLPWNEVGVQAPVVAWEGVLIGEDKALSLPVWQIIDLGTLGGTYSSAYAINDFGTILVASALPGDEVYHTFLYHDGVRTNLGDFAPNDINNAGELLDYNVIQTADGVFSPYDSDDSGTIIVGAIGFEHDPGSEDDETYAAILNDASINIINHTDGSRALAINSAGVIAGDLGSDLFGQLTLPFGGFVYRDGSVTPLPSPGPTWGEFTPADINDAGDVAGTGLDGFGGSKAIVWNADGTIDVIGHLEQFGVAQATAINERRMVVGHERKMFFSNVTTAWLWTESEGLRSLNSLLPLGHPFNVRRAYDINERGEIVGDGVINGETHAFFMRRVL